MDFGENPAVQRVVSAADILQEGTALCLVRQRVKLDFPNRSLLLVHRQKIDKHLGKAFRGYLF